MKTLRLMALLILVVALAAPVMALQALTGSGSGTVSCTGFTDLGSSYTADRNNTGVGNEAYYFAATDGAGNTIHYFASAVPVGFVAPIGNFLWNAGVPQYNPITLRFVSIAGNGFQEQLVGEWSGNCAGLPTFEPPFAGPGLPGNKNLVLFLGDTAILQSPGGEGTGLAMKTCQTAFVIDQKDGFARLFVMGGWVSLANTVDVPEEYGQPGSPVLPQCVGK